MNADTPHERRRIGEILVAAGVLDADDLEEALAAQIDGGRSRLGSTVVARGMASEEDVATALATQLGLQRVSLTTITPEPAATAAVPRALALKHLALPVGLGDGLLTVAVSDPTNIVAKDDLRTAAGVDRVRFVVATESELVTALRVAYGSGELVTTAAEADDTPSWADSEDVSLRADVDSAPIVRLTSRILAEAVEARASDIHVEPGRAGLRVRYRVDGVLREVTRVPRDAAAALVSRLKIMARLDIGERRRPQDGRTVIRVGGDEVDLRVATIPTLFGETVTLRLLRKGDERVALDQVGMDAAHLERFRHALDRPQGLVIITGPTGSGKTSTLYAGLHEIADPVRNIVTLEDPVEYELPGVNQTQVHPKIGLTFARGLRSLLRHDPDVVLVGEVRDEETAQLAMQASFTGHLVLTTLHTNDAPASIVRLIDLGVEPFLIASSLLLVASQRLVRLVCDGCREPYEPDDRVLELLELPRAKLAGANLARGRGCAACGQTGFHGRTGLFEVLGVTPAVREVVLAGASETAVARTARAEGMRTLREDGIRKALSGVTTLDEVLRATPSQGWGSDSCPVCDAHVADGFVACPTCGIDLDGAACKVCGHALEADWVLCPYCRAPAGRSGQRPPLALDEMGGLHTPS